MYVFEQAVEHIESRMKSEMVLDGEDIKALKRLRRLLTLLRNQRRELNYLNRKLNGKGERNGRGKKV